MKYIEWVFLLFCFWRFWIFQFWTRENYFLFFELTYILKPFPELISAHFDKLIPEINKFTIPDAAANLILICFSWHSEIVDSLAVLLMEKKPHISNWSSSDIIILFIYILVCLHGRQTSGAEGSPVRFSVKKKHWRFLLIIFT